MFETLHDDTLIDEAQVRAMLGNISRSELYLRRRKGTVPQPLPHNGRCARWHTGTVRAFVRSLATQQEAGLKPSGCTTKSTARNRDRRKRKRQPERAAVETHFINRFGYQPRHSHFEE